MWWILEGSCDVDKMQQASATHKPRPQNICLITVQIKLRTVKINWDSLTCVCGCSHCWMVPSLYAHRDPTETVDFRLFLNVQPNHTPWFSEMFSFITEYQFTVTSRTVSAPLVMLWEMASCSSEAAQCHKHTRRHLRASVTADCRLSLMLNMKAEWPSACMCLSHCNIILWTFQPYFGLMCWTWLSSPARCWLLNLCWEKSLELSHRRGEDCIHPHIIHYPTPPRTRTRTRTCSLLHQLFVS